MTITGSWPNQTINSSGGGGGAGGGFTTYSSGTATVTLPAAGTTFFPAGGGGPPNSTEANVQSASPAATISKFYVHLSANIGTGNTIAFTFRDGGSDQSVTCTISGAANTCNDTTHSVTVAAGDIISIKAVTTGTVVITPQIVILFSTGGGGGSSVTLTPPYINDGTHVYADVSPAQTTIPGAFTFAWVNQRTITETLVNGAAQWIVPDFGGGGPQVTMRTANLTANTGYTITVCSAAYLNGNAAVNLAITDGTKFITLGYQNPLTSFNTGGLVVTEWSNATTVSATSKFIDNFNLFGSPGICLQLNDAAGTRTYGFAMNMGSLTGQFQTLFTEPSGTFLTETKWGYGLNYNPNVSSNQTAQVIFTSATQTTP